MVNQNPQNQQISGQKQKKTYIVDEKDKKIVNFLSKNSRATLKQISKEIGLSIDAVRSRMKRLERDGVIEFRVLVDPSFLGVPIGVHIYLKLKNMERQKMKEFIDYFNNYNRVIDFMAVLGDYDYYVVLLAKDTKEINDMKNQVRLKFKDLIDDWKEMLVTEVYKLEKYYFD